MLPRTRNTIRALLGPEASAPVRVVAKADGEATIYLYSPIGGWGVLADDFVRELRAIKANVIHLRINSPGGDVFEARAIATAIRQHEARVVAHVDALAASAATYIALAADEVRIAKGAFFMVHRSWTMALGNAGELREVAELLEKIDDSIVADYAQKTGKSTAQVNEWMAAETWFTAEEAVAHGFADLLVDGEEGAGADGAEARWNLAAAYRNVPAALTEPPADPEFDRAAADRQLAILECTAA